MAGGQAETREDLFLAPSLHHLLRHATAEEFVDRQQRAYPPPPLAGILFTLVFGIILAFFSIEIALFIFGLTVLQLLWLGIVLWVRATSNLDAMKNAILEGKFPPAAAHLILARLRWWNHLIVPLHWPKQSRIFEYEKKIETMLKEIEAKIEVLSQQTKPSESAEAKKEEAVSSPSFTASPDAKKEAPPLPFAARIHRTVESETRPPVESTPESPSSPPFPTDPAEIANALHTMSQRVALLDQIQSLPEGLPRLTAQRTFLQGLLYKIKGVTDALRRIDELELHLDGPGFSQNLEQTVAEALNCLEERRQHVIRIDRIQPSDFLLLVSPPDFSFFAAPRSERGSSAASPSSSRNRSIR